MNIYDDILDSFYLVEVLGASVMAVAETQDDCYAIINRFHDDFDLPLRVRSYAAFCLQEEWISKPETSK